MPNILQKEINLLKAMKTQKFEPFFEGDENDAYHTVAQAFESMVDYQNAVIRQSVTQPILYARYDGQDLRDRVQNLDATRRIKHDAAIGNLNMLNRICEGYQVEPICTINTADRYAVADFIGEYCNELYENGQKSNPSAIFQHNVEHHTEYDKKTVRNRMDQALAKFGDIIEKDQTPDLYQKE